MKKKNQIQIGRVKLFLLQSMFIKIMIIKKYKYQHILEPLNESPKDQFQILVLSMNNSIQLNSSLHSLIHF